MQDFNGILDRMAASAPKNINEYLADDGIYRCKVCQKPTRIKINLGHGEVEVPVTCDCDEAQVAARKERERLEEIERRRRICFDQSAMRSWTFENDDMGNERLSNAMLRYAENFSKFLKEGKGLLLYGPVGTGKSFFAGCIANRLISYGFLVKMTNFATLVNDLQGMSIGRNQYIEDLNRYDLLIIDDFGAERNSQYMQELITNIIDSRCRAGLPMIITTNLSGETFKKPESICFERIFDRLEGHCHPVSVNGPSRRKKELRKTFEDMNAFLGL